VSNQITVIGHEPEQAGEEGAPAGGRRGVPVPGVLVEISGTTPKTGLDGQRFVNAELMQDLKVCKRTVRLRTPAGVEILASVPYTGVFGTRPEYDDYYGQARGREEEDVERPNLQRRNDLWFQAQWLVHLDPLTPAQREEVFRSIQDLVREAGLARPTLIDPAQAEGPDKERLAGIEPQLTELADAWLVDREILVDIAAEGMIQDWGTAPPAEGTQAAE
jgi:hypothetical protein